MNESVESVLDDLIQARRRALAEADHRAAEINRLTGIDYDPNKPEAFEVEVFQRAVNQFIAGHLSYMVLRDAIRRLQREA